MTPDPNAPAAPVAGSPPEGAVSGGPGANVAPASSAGGPPQWTRLPIFLTAAAVAASLSLLSARTIQHEIFLRTPVYLAPRGGTEEQRLREQDSVRRRDLRMDASALAAAAALTAGLLGIAGGLCPPPAG
ncbi:hypothetical protein, partial [Alienimonas sp. DA493]|uniref:hypothetical protein n=1 Tax=Alienimonas sp. DA493 TaxID=3373605 RepID=UPI00375413EF